MQIVIFPFEEYGDVVESVESPGGFANGFSALPSIAAYST